MKNQKFSNKANKKIAQKNGATLVNYSNNPGDSMRGQAIELHQKGVVTYYENSKKGSHLYQVETPTTNK
jgi:hypothetical protein